MNTYQESIKLIKGIRMEGLRIVGNPIDRAIQYYEDGEDEIIYSDILVTFAGGSGEYIRGLIY